MPEHARNILSDILRGIPALAEATSTAAGRERLAQWLHGSGEGLAGSIIQFWQQEYIVDD